VSLDELREQIDSMDGEIARLLRDRAAAARKIAAEKAASGLPVRDPAREEAVIADRVRRAEGGYPAHSVMNIFRAIVAETVALQEGELRRRMCAPACPGPSGKRDELARIVENRELRPGFNRMRLAAPGADRLFRPGQFFQIAPRPREGSPFLRRPFAPSELTPDGLAFVYAVVGGGTELMTRLRPGDDAGLLFPLGRGYTLPAPGSRAVLVGGGCGGPSLGPLAAALAAASVETVAVLGARTAEKLVGDDCLGAHVGRLLSCTDDGSAGMAGTAADALLSLLDAGPADAIYACGPTPMLRAVAKIAAERNVFCEVSLEERMACGFGACVGCAVEMLTRDGAAKYGRVCRDGPVFDAKTLAWRA
jgi:dihydroorotate dehydrogenase electron transfer subunit